jgi:hypothetical protein
MRFLLIVNGLIALHFSSFLMAENKMKTLAEDCFQVWTMQAWTIGEDETPASQVKPFSEGIQRICQLRSELHAEDHTISPYIEGRLAEIAPYVFSGDEEAIKQYILQRKVRLPGSYYSGNFLSD